ncbi:MAG: BolA family protein [Myxococcota bacterium]|nr:BolA family protein [Myxococcota bacterium]
MEDFYGVGCEKAEGRGMGAEDGVVMDIQAVIEQKLIEAFSPERLRLDNDSKRHAGPATDSHFRVIIVSQAFEGSSLVQRQRSVYACLSEELAGPVHALQMKCMTPAEYDDADGEVTLKAPPCGGGHR